MFTGDKMNRAVWPVLLFLGLFLAILLTIGEPHPAGVLAAQSAGGVHIQDTITPAEPNAPVNCSATACPAIDTSGYMDDLGFIPSLPQCIERTNFCVYYNSSADTETQANTVADHIEDYWDRYTTDFGFLSPLILAPDTKMQVHLLDVAGCNGAAWYTWKYMYVFDGCFVTPESMQQASGHELFHRVQYRYHGSEARWLKEGTNRVMEDISFNNIDNWPGAMTAPFSFNLEVNNYLVSTNNDITTNAMKYKSCLWWKYFSEQFGSILTEPQRGVDAILNLWQQAATADDIAAVNNSLASLGAGMDFNTAFRRFAVANWTKDLTGLPDDSYNYDDEEQAGNPAPYGPVAPTLESINIEDSAQFSNQAVSRYGIRYYAADMGANCPIVTASFHKDDGDDAFFHVVTQRGTAFGEHRQGSGTNWSQSFLNNGITRLAAIIGGLNDSAQVDITLSCSQPVVDIKLPNHVAVAHVGPYDAALPGAFLAQVLVTDGSLAGPVVSDLATGDFHARVNGLEAEIIGGSFIQEQYWLLIRAPGGQPGNGLYDLEVSLEIASIPTASDTNADSISYDSDHVDHVLVIDRSGSMSEDNKMQAAREAANFYVDATRDDDGLAVVAYNQDVNPTPFHMTLVDDAARTGAETYLAGLTATGSTSIGDGLDTAVKERKDSPTDSPRCSFVLLSDGMENTPKYYADVRADVVDTHCPVTAIAFGAASSEELMQDIAEDTGGALFYNDVYVSAPLAPEGPEGFSEYAHTALDLGNVYEYTKASSERRQRLLSETGEVSYKTPQVVHKVLVDKTVTSLMFALDWVKQYEAILELNLVTPEGKLITPKDLPYSFYDPVYLHLGWFLDKPEPGNWEMRVILKSSKEESVPYRVFASARSLINLRLILPDRSQASFYTGNRVPIYAMLYGKKPIAGAKVEAFISAMDGAQTRLLLWDDGQHDDGLANDGLYANFFTRVNQAEVVWPMKEEATPPTPLDEGAYQVRVVARSSDFMREALGSFSVLESPDTNQNRLPDAFEKEYGVSNPQGDPDLDGLINYDEYRAGTNPNDSDTDDGGEGDGSEVLTHKTDPLDPRDDGIRAPQFLHARALNGYVRLLYEFMDSGITLRLYRATSPGGPWELRSEKLPREGQYDDKADNGVGYFYRLLARDSLGLTSAVVDAGAETIPSKDPLPPEALVLINHGAATTPNPKVSLSFAPYETEGQSGLETFQDIAEVMISNDPFLAGAKWQAFKQDIPWMLDVAKPGDVGRVYVRFRDAAGNESIGTTVAMITYQPLQIYLPVVRK
jgi:hypothetical protein